MPDASSLYPQAPAPQQSLLSGDPTKMIGMMQGIQNFQIQQAQAPALMQIPGANLQNLNIANATAQFQQEDAMTKAVYSKLGGALAGTVNPTQEDVLNAATATSRGLPQIGVSRPDIIASAKEMLLKDPTKIGDAAKTMVNMGISPEAGSTL